MKKLSTVNKQAFNLYLNCCATRWLRRKKISFPNRTVVVSVELRASNPVETHLYSPIESNERLDSLLATRVEELKGLSARASNVFSHYGSFVTLGQLVRRVQEGKGHILYGVRGEKVKNCGKTTLKELIKRIEDLDLMDKSPLPMGPRERGALYDADIRHLIWAANRYTRFDERHTIEKITSIWKTIGEFLEEHPPVAVTKLMEAHWIEGEARSDVSTFRSALVLFDL